MDEAGIKEIIESQREFFRAGVTRDPSFRIEQLNSLSKVIYDNRRQILKALRGDLGKPVFEAYTAEISQTLHNCSFTAKRLRSWMRPRRTKTPRYLFPASSHVYPEPFGVALIISPWNYPLELAISPLIGAIAAGNCAVVKPSEITPMTSSVVARIIGEAFEPSFVSAVEGGTEVAQALIAQEFDHIFYTGGGAVGRLVMEAAAEHLTPVTLELGGKSPCIVEPDVNLEHTARRIAWGKYFNAGQTCIAPDYLLVNEALKQELLEAVIRCINSFYGEDPEMSPDYARIVSDKHFQRVVNLMGAGNVIHGGKSDAGSRYIAPTVIDGISEEDPIMQEEIFGPLLPVLEYRELNQAIEFVNSRPKPLSLYFFSRDRRKQERILAETSAGGCCINDTMVHYSNSFLPFGGVGDSGMGKYHGRWSFDTFSNEKAVIRRVFPLDIYLRYPPYGRSQKLVQRFIRYVT
jgi:aldehyde dehydrogenase (NAD+)